VPASMIQRAEWLVSGAILAPVGLVVRPRRCGGRLVLIASASMVRWTSWFVRVDRSDDATMVLVLPCGLSVHGCVLVPSTHSSVVEGLVVFGCNLGP
jgi:hypothetical protein